MPCARSAHAATSPSLPQSSSTKIGTGERRLSSGPSGSPAGSGCSAGTGAIAAFGGFSRRASSQRPVLVHVHLQREVGDAAHRAHALDVEAVTPAELQLEAAEASFAGVFSARRAMSSRSPSQIVHEVGGPARRRPSSLCTGRPRSLPWRSWSAPSIAFRAENCSHGRRSKISSSAKGSSPSASGFAST